MLFITEPWIHDGIFRPKHFMMLGRNNTNSGDSGDPKLRTHALSLADTVWNGARTARMISISCETGHCGRLTWGCCWDRTNIAWTCSVIRTWRRRRCCPSSASQIHCQRRRRTFCTPSVRVDTMGVGFIYRVISTPVSYSRGLTFEAQVGDQLSWLIIFVGFRCPCALR
jgi:hypothetical protein